jgi:hypothetical protein
VDTRLHDPPGAVAPFGSYGDCSPRAPMGWGSSHTYGDRPRGMGHRADYPRSGGSSAPATPLSTSRLVERKVAVGLPSGGIVGRAPEATLGTAPPPRVSSLERTLGGSGGVASPPPHGAPTPQGGFIGRRPDRLWSVQRESLPPGPCPSASSPLGAGGLSLPTAVAPRWFIHPVPSSLSIAPAPWGSGNSPSLFWGCPFRPLSFLNGVKRGL